VRKLACAFFKCSIYPLNSCQIEHKGGSKLPHSKGFAIDKDNARNRVASESDLPETLR
jgi:hypothetical protein